MFSLGSTSFSISPFQGSLTCKLWDYLLDCVFQFAPVWMLPCSCHDRLQVFLSAGRGSKRWRNRKPALIKSPMSTWAPACSFWPKIDLIARLDSASRRVGTNSLCKAGAGHESSMLVWVDSEQD